MTDIFVNESNFPEFFNLNCFIMLNYNLTTKKLLNHKEETLRYVQKSFCNKISKIWQMVTDFVRGGHYYIR